MQLKFRFSKRWALPIHEGEDLLASPTSATGGVGLGKSLIHRLTRKFGMGIGYLPQPAGHLLVRCACHGPVLGTPWLAAGWAIPESGMPSARCRASSPASMHF